MVHALKAGMTLEQFYDASWFEVHVCLRGYYERLTDTKWLFAWHLAPILNWVAAFSGKLLNITPKHLMGVVTRKEVE